MKDFVGVTRVISAERLAELSMRRNGPALYYLVSHWGAIAVTSWAMHLTWSTWWCIPFFLLQGVLLNFLYAPTHECDHHTAFESHWLNVWVARLCGFVIFNPSEHHRWSHFTHHRNTQNWQNDTELVRPVFRSVRDYALFMTGCSTTKSKLNRIFRHAFFGAHEWYMTEPQQRGVATAARWHVAGYLLALASAVVLQSWWILYYWWGPMLVMGWTYRLQGSAEHTFLTHEANTLLNTRILRTNWFMHWVNWNMTYHSIHHTFPSVPFFRLPELCREVENILGYELPGGSYFRLHWGIMKALAGGKSELDICAEHTAELVSQDKLEARG